MPVSYALALYNAYLLPRLINVLAVEWYGETEFWAALGKVLLIVGLVIYTFIVMLGGNPIGDRFGFRYAVTTGRGPGLPIC